MKYYFHHLKNHACHPMNVSKGIIKKIAKILEAKKNDT
jgi:hypothetical protein